MAIYQDSIVVTQPLLLISGQTPQKDEHIPHTIEEQLDIVIEKIDAIIKANDAQASAIVNMNIYLTDRTYLTTVREKITAYMGDIKPTMTLVIVAGLVHEAFKVEIDATVLLHNNYCV